MTSPKGERLDETNADEKRSHVVGCLDKTPADGRKTLKKR